MRSDADDVVEMVKQLADLDFSAMPAPIFMGALRRELIQLEFPVADAELIASKIDLEMQPGILEVEHINQLGFHYARMIRKLYDTLVMQNFDQPLVALVELARKMTLKLT